MGGGGGGGPSAPPQSFRRPDADNGEPIGASEGNAHQPPGPQTTATVPRESSEAREADTLQGFDVVDSLARNDTVPDADHVTSRPDHLFKDDPNPYVALYSVKADSKANSATFEGPTSGVVFREQSGDGSMIYQLPPIETGQGHQESAPPALDPHDPNRANDYSMLDDSQALDHLMKQLDTVKRQQGDEEKHGADQVPTADVTAPQPMPRALQQDRSMNSVMASMDGQFMPADGFDRSISLDEFGNPRLPRQDAFDASTPTRYRSAEGKAQAEGLGAYAPRGKFPYIDASRAGTLAHDRSTGARK